MTHGLGSQPRTAIRAWFAVAVVASVCGLASFVFGEFGQGIALVSTTVAALGAVRCGERWSTWKVIALDLGRQIADRDAEDHDAR